jgi:hypothetical protein
MDILFVIQNKPGKKFYNGRNRHKELCKCCILPFFVGGKHPWMQDGGTGKMIKDCFSKCMIAFLHVLEIE